MPGPSPYFSYLLRLWLAGDSDQPQWRASLDNPRTGERVGFANPDAMFTFLKNKMQSNPVEQTEPEEPYLP